MIDPMQVAEMLATATTTYAPTHTVKPIPTVLPTPPEIQHAGPVGFRTLWVVFVLFVLSSAFFAALSWKIHVSKRLFHIITTLITIIAALSYFAMATGQGVSFTCSRTTDGHDHVPDTHHLVCRQIYWARYIDWLLTTPLLILDLSLLAGIDGAHTLLAIIADVIMVFSGLLGATGRAHTASKWGWYAIAVIAYLFVIWQVALHGSATVKAKGGKVVRLFSGLAIFTFVLWTAYPVVWAVADGARLTSVDTEIVLYAILDLLAKSVFGAWLLLAHHRLPESHVEIGGYWAHGLASEGRIRIGDSDGA